MLARFLYLLSPSQFSFAGWTCFQFFHLCHCNNYFFPFTFLSQQSLYSNLFSLQFVVYFFSSSINLFFFIACFASSIVILIFMFSLLCVHSSPSLSLFLPLFFVFWLDFVLYFILLNILHYCLTLINII